MRNKSTIKSGDASVFSKRARVLCTLAVVYLISYFAAGDSLRVRRVALDLYPWLSQEALRRRCLDHPTHLEPKGKGDNSMLRNAAMSCRYVGSCAARYAHYDESSI